MFRENIFRKAKRHISQFFETEYWYRFRKLHKYWLDDDTGRWEECAPQRHARDIITSTWEGEDDLWGAMLLKIDHMFWNLKKYGVEKKYYFKDLSAATREDRRFLASKKLKDALSKEKELLLCNTETDDKSISDDGIVNFYLKYCDNEIVLVEKIHRQIPPKSIPKKNKFYSLDVWRDENGKIRYDMSREAPQYRSLESSEIARTARDLGDFAGVAWMVAEKLGDYISRHGCLKCELDFSREPSGLLEDILLERPSGFDVDIEIEDLPKLSPQLRKTAVGNFVKCRDLLRLRRLIKNLLAMDDMDDKYSTWRNAETKEEKNKSFKADRENFQKDRKEAYRKICDLMCEKGLNWWD